MRAVEWRLRISDLVQHLPRLILDGIPVLEIDVVGVQLEATLLPTPEHSLHAKIFLRIGEFEKRPAPVVVANYVGAGDGHVRPKLGILRLDVVRHAVGVQYKRGVLERSLLRPWRRVAVVGVILDGFCVAGVIDHVAGLMTQRTGVAGGGWTAAGIEVFRVADDVSSRGGDGILR